MKKDYDKIITTVADINPDAINLDGLEKCVIGICDTFEGAKLLYSERKIIDKLKADGMTYDEAVEYFEYKILGGYHGTYSPVFLMDLEEY